MRWYISYYVASARQSRRKTEQSSEKVLRLSRTQPLGERAVVDIKLAKAPRIYTQTYRPCALALTRRSGVQTRERDGERWRVLAASKWPRRRLLLLLRLTRAYSRRPEERQSARHHRDARKVEDDDATRRLPRCVPSLIVAACVRVWCVACLSPYNRARDYVPLTLEYSLLGWAGKPLLQVASNTVCS